MSSSSNQSKTPQETPTGVSNLFEQNTTKITKPISEFAQNEMANYLAKELKNTLTIDPITEHWLQKTDSNIWRVIRKKHARLVIEQRLEKVKPTYSESYISSIIRLLDSRLCAPSWTNERHLLPLKNGVFNLQTNKLEAYNDYTFNWQLPFKYNPISICPKIKKWLEVATQNDEGIKHFLICWMQAVLTGRHDLQKYLEIIGHGGTGKGTYTRIISALVGTENIIITDLKSLEKNRFETANLYGKRLVIITDAKYWGGEVSVLKAITGGDSIRYERKGVQGGESFLFEGLVLIASNENIKTSDYTSGLSRRRITVPFEHIISEEEKAENPDFEHQLHSELSGLFNVLISLKDDGVTQAIRQPVDSIKKAKFEAELNTNSLLAWLHEKVEKCDFGRESRIGDKSFDIKNGMYANYVKYCEDNGNESVALKRFSELIITNCVSRGIPTKKYNQAGTNRAYITNLRLKHDKNSEKGLFC